MVQRLPDTSMTAALVNGGKENFGWGKDRHMVADLFDALNVNTRATGNFKKDPKFPEYPRPGRKQKKAEEKKPVSLAALHKQLSTRR